MCHDPDIFGTPKWNERRRSKRFELTGGAWFQWQSADGRWHPTNGVTGNIGSGGAFVYASVIPPMASPVTLTVTLEWEGDRKIRLSGSGVVCHTRRNSGSSGYGASVLFRATSLPYGKQ